MKRLTYILSTLLFVGVMCGLQVPQVQATTTIDGVTITEDTTWTKEADPYIITWYLEVYDGATLTIEPGTEVIFDEDNGNYLWVGYDGLLDVNGSKNDPVRFHLSSALQNQGSEASVEFDSASGELSHAEFGDGVNVQIADSDVTLTNTNHMGGDEHGLEVSGESSAVLEGALVENYEEAGVYVEGTSPQLEVASSTIRNNTRGIEFFVFGFGGGIGVSGLNTPSDTNGIITNSVIADNSNYGVEIDADPGEISVNARNNFWGDSSGPNHPSANPDGNGDKASEEVLVDPWLTNDPLTEPEGTPHSSVAFIPGFQGSRLYEHGSGINSNDLEQRWESNFYTDIPRLNLNKSGESINDIRVGEPIDNIPLFGSIHGSFIEFLEGLKEDESIENWRAFPYDWRKAQDAVVEEEIKYLEEGTYSMVDRVKKLAENSGTGKVTIVGHSNGGLVGKLLISRLKEQGKANLVDKLIMIGTPQIGTPKGIPGVLNGEGQEYFGGWVVDKSDAVDLARNMPGAHSLIPSRAYMDTVSRPPVTFDDNAGLYTDEYGSVVDDYSELTDFLLGAEGRRKPDSTQEPIRANESVLAQSQAVQDTLDDWQPPENVDVTEIVGWGMETIENTRYSVSNEMECDENYLAGTMECERFKKFGYKPLMTREGDGTVVWPSADYMETENHYLNLDKINSDSENRYNHAKITEISELQNVISDIVAGNPIQFSDKVLKMKPDSSTLDSTLRFSVHSPVDITVTNSSGEKVEIKKSQESGLAYPVEEITNSTYLEYGEGKYIFVPANGEYEIILDGTGTSTFTFNAQEVSGTGDVMASTTFKHVPVSTSTEASVDLDKDNLASSTLSLDYDGNGSEDKEFKTGLGIVTISHIRDAIDGADIHHGIENAINAKVDSIERSIDKDKYKQVRKKAEKLIQFVDKHSQIKKKGKKKGRKNKRKKNRGNGKKKGANRSGKQPKINSEDGDTIESLLRKFKNRFYEK